MRWSHVISRRVLLTTVLVGITASACKETVTEPIAVASVTVTGGGGTLRLGQSTQLTTTLKSTEGWTLPNVGVSWTSSDVAKATISPSGQVTAVARGPVTLTAAAGGVSGTGAVTVIGVQSIALAPETLSVIVTQTRAMTATTVLDPGVTVTPTWRSLDTTIAKVDTAGRVTAKSTTGLVRIEVTAEDKKDTAVVRVIPVPVVSVVVTPDTATRGPGQTVQLTATPKDSIGGTLTGRTVTWSSSDASKATVSSTGLVTGVATGSAVITATIEGKTATSNITIRVPINEITLTQSSCTGSGSQSGTTARLYTTETCQYSATPRDASGNTLLGRNLTWSVSDTTVAKIDGAAFAHPTTQLPTVKLLPQKGGTINLVVAGEGKTGSISVEVLAPVATVTVSPATATLTVGATQQITATLRDAAGNTLTGRMVTWSVTDSNVASVTTGGLVTAKSNGNATITAESEGKTASASISVITQQVPTNRSIVFNNQALNVVRVSAAGVSSGTLVAGVHPIQIDNKLIFRGGFGDNRLYSSNLSGSNRTTFISGFSFAPDGNPHTTKIVLHNGDCGTNSHTVATAGLDGTNVQTISGVCAMTPPRMSPSGSEVLYQTTAGIEIVNIATQAKRTVLQLAGNTTLTGWRWYGNTSWSSDGSKLSFIATTGSPAQYCLFVVNTNGTNLQRLSNACGTDLGYHDWDWETGTFVVEMNSGTSSSLHLFSENGAVLGSVPNTAGATWPRWTRSSTTTPVATIAVTPVSLSIAVSGTQQLTAVLKDAGGNVLTGRTVSWNSSNSSIATVSSTGIVTGNASGTVTITATSEGKSAASTIFVRDADGWIVRDGRKYKFIAGNRTWTSSRTEARSISLLADLASLETVEEQKFIKDYLSSLNLGAGRIWIGLFQDTSAPDYVEPAGAWKWVSGIIFDGSGWYSGEPNNMGGPENSGHLIMNPNHPSHLLFADLRDSETSDNIGYIAEVGLNTGIDSGLVARYAFSMGSIADVSGNDKQATLKAGTWVKDRFGVDSSAIEFDGLSGGIATADSVLSLGQDYSISLWFSMKDFSIWTAGGSCCVAGLIGSNPHTGIGFGFDHNVPGASSLALGDGMTFWKVLYNRGTKTSWLANTWYHAVLRKSGARYQVFIDGSKVHDVEVVSATSFTKKIKLSFGANWQDSQVAKAKIDDVRIYRRTITDQEIATLSADRP